MNNAINNNVDTKGATGNIDDTSIVTHKEKSDKSSNVLSTRDSNVLRVYGCGGTGTNISRIYFQFMNQQSDLFASIQPVILDASDSDITTDIPSEFIYLVEGANGSGEVLKGGGKKRNLNYDDIKRSVKNMLLEHVPGDFNIVIHSNSGASGSVIGPLVVSELMSRGEQVIVLMVGSTSSEIEVKNNADTIKSYEYQSAHIYKKPILAVYRENSVDSPMKKIDSELQTIIGMISILVSGKNRKLDKTDIAHFLDYTSVSDFNPSLTSLELFGPTISINKSETLIGVVTLTDEKTSHELSTPKYYQAVGILPANCLDNVKSELPLNFCTVKGRFHNVIDKMKTILDQYKTTRSAVVEKSILSATNDDVNEDGMFL